ncbi:uncharacterized protein TNCV_3759211 [Trichonephila clavipes]|nr:uncharacterized protein TNCV_3759211 [Trichonephila clavipes]
MLNGGVSIESRLFPRMVCIAQRTSFKWKGENSKGPSMKQGKGDPSRPSMQGKQAKYQMGKGDPNRSSIHLGRWSNTVVSCPECQEPMTVRHFYSEHAVQKYNVDCRKQCLFCFGRKHWPYGQKNHSENVNHVTACLQRFVEDAKIHEETEEEETEEVVCGCRQFRPVPR